VTRRPPPQRRPRRATAAARQRAPRRPVRPSYWRRRVAALLAFGAIAGALYLINATFQPFHGTGSGRVALEIPAGADAGDIGELLARRGVVKSGRFFTLNATLTGRRGRLRSGDYTLARGMSYGDAIEVLTQGPPAKAPAKTFDVTLPEGRARRELAPIVRRSGVEGSYLRATQAERARRRARRLGLPSGARTLEGFLFPATYELVEGASARALVTRQLRAFADALERVDLGAAQRRNLTRYDVITIASMVEREASVAKERPLVAAVIHNRLRQGIPLGIDATIRYAEDNWTQPLRESELQRPGPYNTRLNQGLPPTPIGNPGLASLRAAARPANVDYLYYVVKPGTCGEHAFSSSDAEFQRDVARYNDERAARGGRSPTDC
jgi:UPF0755 protein